MARLDQPLFGSEATGPLARVLFFRRTDPTPSVARAPGLPFRSSASQLFQRAAFSAARSLWLELSPASRATYAAAHPPGMTGYNFFLFLTMVPGRSFFGFAVLGDDAYFDWSSQWQPTLDDFILSFPYALDFFPVILDGRHSVSALLFNSIFSVLTSHELALINSSIP